MKHVACLVVLGVAVWGCVVAARAGGSEDVVGPDVIVGDLHQTKHWGSNGSGTIHAYSVGTVACNIGDTPLLWQSWSNQRPLIGQTMYRLKNGRFEQLGQSWLKWSFTSLNQSFCNTCIPPGSSSLLGVNCSDPYSANLNGSQSSLGPKYIVNPFTGYFQNSHGSPGNGTIDGLLQVHTPDIDPNQNAGASYFVEGQYVTPDDASAGNLYNNASYRQVWVQSNLDLTFSNPQGGQSATERKKPAIEVWKVLDPNVGLVIFNVPSDGRLYLVAKATPNGGGSWHYELALHNLNSDRSIGGITVLLPSGSNPTNLGFHDVDYHSGEPYSGTDWPGSIVAAGVHWETTSYATDPNANALRWGTMYNFRFDAAVAPTFVTQADLMIFKPGTPSAMTVDIDQGPYLLGDMNCDGLVDFDDINSFVEALSDPVAWQAAHPSCPLENADTNGDTVVDFDDVNAFVALLSGG